MVLASLSLKALRASEDPPISLGVSVWLSGCKVEGLELEAWVFFRFAGVGCEPCPRSSS